MRFLFVVHKNEEKAEQNSVLFHRLTLKERGLRPNGYFPLMRQPLLMYLFDYKRSPSYLSGANPKISLASAGVATSLLSSFAI